jgi:hypothetical protein
VSSLGLYGGLPWEFGGGESFAESEHLALLEAFAPGWDTSEDTEHWIECFAHGVALGSIWDVNGRLANQGLPLRMLEALTTWEQACSLRPSPKDFDSERRRRVAAKFLGIVSNTFGAIYDACAAVLGSTFVDLLTVAVADVIAFWNGGTPGPPGYEWSSNRVHVQVRVTEAGLTKTEFLDKMSALNNTLDVMIPAWMTFGWSTETDFTVNRSIVGEASL